MNPYQMKKEDVLKMLGTDENGLTQNQAKENQKKYGKNELAEGKKKNPFILFLEQYKDFLVIILIASAIIRCARRYRKCDRNICSYNDKCDFGYCTAYKSGTVA